MGQKTHPIGFRLGTTRDWTSHWFGVNPKDYRTQVLEDHKIRDHIQSDLGQSSGISHIQIQRNSEDLAINIHTSRPGIVIGRGGSNVDKLRNSIEKITSKKANISITEIRQPDLNARLVAQNIAEQIERRVAIKRAMRQVGNRCMQNGAKGIKILISGRLGGADIARSDKMIEGRVPLHTLRAEIDYAIAEARTTYGIIGVKVWIYNGEVGAIDKGLSDRAVQRLEESISQNKEILELTNDQDSSKDTPTDNKSNQSAPIREILDNGPETESVKNIDSDKADIETKSQPKKTTAKKTTAKKTTAKKTTAKKTTAKKTTAKKT
ncbi:MAG: 30S ribosomal protein S3, partial [Chloroflexi bacterium]|nr:30S ribosomal protein S3 [Chloroflexota bacterium]